MWENYNLSCLCLILLYTEMFIHSHEYKIVHWGRYTITYVVGEDQGVVFLVIFCKSQISNTQRTIELQNPSQNKWVRYIVIKKTFM